MPLVSIESNQTPTEEQRQQLLAATSSLAAEALGKPENYVMVSFRHNPSMLFGGSTAPLAYLELKSIGLPENRTSELSGQLCNKVSCLLGIEPSRIYIEFSGADRHMWGWKGATFAG